MMKPNEAQTVICTYRPKAEDEPRFRALLATHWPTLRELGLVDASHAPQHFRGEESGGPFYVEIFAWRDPRAMEIAHQSPEVLRIWEPMERLCESRGGLPSMSFPHVEPLSLAE